MPVHDWTRVEAGIFHDFHHAWIGAIKRTLNGGVLPEGYYALAEQHAAGFGPDVLTLQESNGNTATDPHIPSSGGGVALAPPKLQPVGEADIEFYRRKQDTVAVHHVSDDRVVAVVEIVSPGNKASRNPLRNFVEKAASLLEKGVHLLILDLFPPGERDPNGVHALIWEDISGQPYTLPADRPLTLAPYERGLTVRTYVAHVAVGDALPDVPLFLAPGGSVEVPLEATYQAAWSEVPRRWQRVLEQPA